MNELKRIIISFFIVLFVGIAGFLLSNPQKVYATTIIICKGDKSVCAEIGNVKVKGDAIIITN